MMTDIGSSCGIKSMKEYLELFGF